MPHPKGRAFRRAQNKKSRRRGRDNGVTRYEKRWALLYTRSVKNKRAQQPGYLWPNPKLQLSDLMEDEF